MFMNYDDNILNGYNMYAFSFLPQYYCRAATCSSVQIKAHFMHVLES